jgi:hypothetical protein
MGGILGRREGFPPVPGGDRAPTGAAGKRKSGFRKVPGKAARRVRELGEPGSRVFVTTAAAAPAVAGKEGGACGRCGAGIDKRDRLCGGCARALGVCPWRARKK